MVEHVLLPGTSANQLCKHARMLVATLPGHEKILTASRGGRRNGSEAEGATTSYLCCSKGCSNGS